MNTLLDIFKAYNGTGYYCILFIAALLYLWFIEEDKRNRCLLIYTPAIIQVLFFIPYFYMLYDTLDNGTYYRVLWMLPMTVVIAYAGCRLIGVHTKMGLALLAVLLIFSGTYVYTGEYMRVAENEYHIPQEVIEVCDMIRPDEGRERVWAAFPPEMVHFVRQYTTTIQLPFGRDQLVSSWKKNENPLYDLYASDYVMDMEQLSEYATEYYCNYVILEKDRDLSADPETVELKLVGETDSCRVYRNLKVDFWDMQ